ncbi:immunoglobulin-like domain-containing protein [Turicibacter sanguinis]|uniref:immunoglobulin-like domain-containing protein n=1 Tax=Turicibacter sanguinis TaxID=154288 RepID=UPI00189CC162|nr:immunoglobulin-like domain-containing protein [Turicibacter sanguinis]
MVKKSILFLFILFMTFTTISTTHAMSNDIVNIPDQSLKIALNEALGNSSESDITKKQLSTLKVANLNGKGISNLEGLQYATNLTLLRLQDNQISDLSPLTNLRKLNYLILTNNKIQDISALSHLVNLSLLNIASNEIRDLGPLSNLDELVYLYLADNNLYDMTPVTEMEDLEIIDFSNNHVKDISRFKSLAQYLYGWGHEQTIDLGEYSVKKGDTLKIKNPILDFNGPVGKVNVEDGYYDLKTDEVVWENIQESQDLKFTFSEIASSSDGGEIEFDGTVFLHVNLDLGQTPIISGATDLTLSVGTPFNSLEGVTAYDAEDDDLTSQIQVRGMVDINIVGRYELIYSVMDSSGNTTTVTRIISVLPSSSIINELPVIQARDKIIKVGDAFDPSEGVTAYDIEDGNLTSEIKIIENNVNASVSGTYHITYQVSDRDGALVTNSVTITVMNQVTPNTGFNSWLLLGIGVVLCTGGIVLNRRKEN